jgi:hypothetical protein
MIDVPGAIKEVGSVLDSLFTSDDERAKAKIALREIEQRIPLAQAEINKQEASNRSVFVAGWRPFIGWICGFGAMYDFILRPIANGLLPLLKISTSMPGPDTAALMSLLFGMLGLGGLRTFEKLKGVSK